MRPESLAFVNHWLAMLDFTGVAIMWLVPDRHVEWCVAARESSSGEAVGGQRGVQLGLSTPCG
ncbi:MAG TPA: hypothetical protein VIM01_08815, partial [Dermatophilaceae bacterium]